MTSPITRAVTVLAALAVAGTVGGCCGTPPADRAAESTPASIPGVDPGEVEVLQNMVVHDQQAVELCALVPGRTTNARVVALAQQIAAEQRSEINGFQVQLLQWDAPPVGPHSSQTQGRVDQATMDKLKTLTGAEFDTLWLQSMLAHHHGSVAMAQQQIDHGKNPEITGIAQPVVKTQSLQIDQLKSLSGGG